MEGANGSGPPANAAPRPLSAPALPLRSRKPWPVLLSHLSMLLGFLLVVSVPYILEPYWPIIAYTALKLVAHVAQPTQCRCPLERGNLRPKDAVVLLVQKKRMPMMMDALEHFHRNFNDCFRKDVLLFHNGDFTAQDQKQVVSKYPLVQFHLLEPGGHYWRVPPELEKRKTPWRSTQGYSEGYRHMCRFHYKMVFEWLEKHGYEWFMRLDDDSFILSCIDYDIFQFMEDGNYSYGWRLAQLEYHDFAEVLPEMVDAYVQEKKIPLSLTMNSHYDGGTLSAETWDRWTYYNNFMITRVSWWRQKMVTRWIDRVDDAGVAYVHRVGDAPIQTFTTMMFMHKKQVYHFQDFTYNHGPIIGVSSRSLVPALLRPLTQQANGSDSEWVSGLYNMSESPRLAPVLRRSNTFMRNSLGITWR